MLENPQRLCITEIYLLMEIYRDLVNHTFYVAQR